PTPEVAAIEAAAPAVSEVSQAPSGSEPVARLEWQGEIDRASRMEAVGALLVEFCEQRHFRAMLFVDFFGVTMVWRGSGSPELKAALVGRVDFSVPSMFSTAATTRKPAVYLAPGSEADRKFLAALPDSPLEAMVFPVSAPRQPLLVLYVDGGHRSLPPTDTDELFALCAAAARAYARITTVAD
ncbi:MAG: hypothetical protein H6Q89_4431, partial [Myxococcaceae bacterium]|nr:hypothetical protein [Myxococcaceae bacterium]